MGIFRGRPSFLRPTPGYADGTRSGFHHPFSLRSAVSDFWQTLYANRANPLPLNSFRSWLPRKDSNLDKENQNLLCYRYTTRQCVRKNRADD